MPAHDWTLPHRSSGWCCKTEKPRIRERNPLRQRPTQIPLINNHLELAQSYAKAYSTWAYAQQAFDGWAQQFRARLDQAHGR